MLETQSRIGERERNVLCRAGALAALLLLIYSFAAMALLLTIGGQPATAEEAFALLQKNRLVGLLRLDALTMIAMPLYYVLYAGLYVALRRTSPLQAGLAAALAFIGLTLFLSTPSVLSLAHLSEQHSAADSEARKSQLLAAGEALIASDMWHAAASWLGGILLQAAGVVISLAMWKGKIFGRITAGLGLLTSGLDLAHVLIGVLVPTAGFILMAVAGPLYLAWFPLLGKGLYELSGTHAEPRPQGA